MAQVRIFGSREDVRESVDRSPVRRTVQLLDRRGEVFVPARFRIAQSLACHPKGNLIAGIAQNVKKVFACAAPIIVELGQVFAGSPYDGQKPAVTSQVLRWFHLRPAERSEVA